MVRDDTQQADVVFQVAVQHLPGLQQLGRQEPLRFNSTGGRPQGLLRPALRRLGAALASFFDGDYNMIRFLESQGYNVTYATSVDPQANPTC